MYPAGKRPDDAPKSWVQDDSMKNTSVDVAARFNNQMVA